MMEKTKNISPRQFAIFRIIFGSYLAIHFFHLVPFSAELFSSAGAIPDPSVNFTYGFFPNPLDHFDSPAFVTAFVAVLGILALLFAGGIWRRPVAVILWFGWACLFSRNNLISNPGIPYVGLLLIICAIIPSGEGLTATRRKTDPDWQMPAMLYWGAWILLSAGYTYSGYWKLLSPSWQDGTAMHHVITNPLARDWWFNDLLLQLPAWSLQGLAWFMLAGELLALPMLFWRKTRLVSWCWMVAMHVGILFVIDFADLTFGMLMIHLFTFDPDWLKSWKRRSVAQGPTGILPLVPTPEPRTDRSAV